MNGIFGLNLWRHSGGNVSISTGIYNERNLCTEKNNFELFFRLIRIFSLFLFNSVVSGSRDMTLRVWNIDTGACLHVLMGHTAAVRCVQYDGRLVVSGAYDFTVKVWDPQNECCLHTLTEHTNRVYSLQVN